MTNDPSESARPFSLFWWAKKLTSLLTPKEFKLPATWIDRYPINVEYYRKLIKEDPFKKWDKIGFPSSSMVGINLGTGEEIAFVGGDASLAEGMFRRAIRIAERIWSDELFVRMCSPELAVTYSSFTKRDELLARLFLDQSWNPSEFQFALNELVDLLFSSNWSIYVKMDAIEAIRMAYMEGNAKTIARIHKKLDKLRPVDEMTMWSSVGRTSERHEKAEIVRRFLTSCPPAYNNAKTGTPRFQSEIAIVYLRLSGYAMHEITLELVRDIVMDKSGVRLDDQN